MQFFLYNPLQGLHDLKKKHVFLIHKIEKQFFGSQSSANGCGFWLSRGFCGSKIPYQDMSHKYRSLQKNINCVKSIYYTNNTKTIT